MSKREDVLNALFKRISTLSDIPVKRNEILPQKIPQKGLIILRDGNIGEPDIFLSVPRYLFHHRAEIEILVQDAQNADRDALLDEILVKIGKFLMIDPTLSGTIDYMYADPPEFIDETIEGGIAIKGAIVPIVLEYTSDSNLT